ncbi:DUF4476 domain-containing protein [bacterium SCSIO 12643]|nr:DUF4476 domain-containing protein [bacterium SCSIO 12643]
MIFVSYIGHSQESKVVFFTHKLGNFYLYIDDHLVNRIPMSQVQYPGQPKSSIHYKIVFQNRELMPLKGELYIKNDKTHIQVIYYKNEQVLIYNFHKVKIGKYKPGYVGPVIPQNDTYQGRYGCVHLLSDVEFEKYLNQIRKEHHTQAKTTLIQQLIKNHCISVFQLKQILLTLPKKNDQIEIVKFAWAYIYDQENYKTLHPMFPNEFMNILEYVHVNQ